MAEYPIAYAHDIYRDCAQVIVGQLERRETDPIQVLIGEAVGGTPTCFRRQKAALDGGRWCWSAIDELGREVRSGVIHDDAPCSASMNVPAAAV